MRKNFQLNYKIVFLNINIEQFCIHLFLYGKYKFSVPVIFCRDCTPDMSLILYLLQYMTR